MKKRLLALMLVVAIVMGMSMTTMAETTYDPTEEKTFTIRKTYTSTENFVPGEKLAFEIKANGENPDAEPVISIGEDNTYTVNGLENDITVTVPAYDTAGIYKYTIKEVEGNTAGVTYDTTTTIEVIVLVGYDNTNDKLVITQTSYILKDTDGNKVDVFKNEFETGDFTVAKKVTGNMANENDEFEITVTLTSEKPVLTDINVAGITVAPNKWTLNDSVYTYTFTGNYSESAGAKTFSDIPVGVTVAVEETELSKNGYIYKSGNKNFTITTEGDYSVEIVNEKGASVDTGIFTTNMPYILALVAIAAVAVAMFRRKREF